MGCGSSNLKSLPDGPSDVSCESSSSRKKLGENGGKKTDQRGKAPKYRTKVDSRVVAKYDIKALLGKGSFSDVLRVENKLTKQPFAIKILRLRGPESRELFESELEVLRHIQHPLIIKLAEVFEAKDHVYLVMELATGGELYDRIKSKGHYQEKEAIRVLQMVLDGVSYLHENGITHRDLKPENLLFYHPGQDSKILITDFGFAASKLKSEGSMFTTFCGTPEYIAPEVLSKKPYTNAVDMWAIGVIAFVMLSGHLPFPSDTTAKLFTQIVTAEFSFTREVWKTVSQEAKDFISKLLVVDYNNRLKAKDAVKVHWVTSVTPLPVLLKSSTFGNNYAKYAAQMNANQLGKSQRSIKSNRVFQTRRRASSSAISDSQFSQSTGRVSQTQQKYLEVSGKLLEQNQNHTDGLHLMGNGNGVDHNRGVRSSPYLRARSNNQTNLNNMESQSFGLESVTDVTDPQARVTAGGFSSAAATEDSNSIAIPSVDVSHSVLSPNHPLHVNRNAADSISTASSVTGRDDVRPQIAGALVDRSFENNGLDVQRNGGHADSRLDARKIAHLDSLFSPHRKSATHHVKPAGPFKEKVGVWLDDQHLFDGKQHGLSINSNGSQLEGLGNGFAFSSHAKPLSLPPLQLARPTLAVPPAVELDNMERRISEDGAASGTLSSSRTFLQASQGSGAQQPGSWQDFPSGSTSQGAVTNSPRSTLNLIQNAYPTSIS